MQHLGNFDLDTAATPISQLITTSLSLPVSSDNFTIFRLLMKNLRQRVAGFSWLFTWIYPLLFIQTNLCFFQQQKMVRYTQALSLMSRLYVGSISLEVQEEILRQMFEVYGPVKSLNMCFDTASGVSFWCSIHQSFYIFSVEKDLLLLSLRSRRLRCLLWNIWTDDRLEAEH